jgi:RimJ/RimL family protein N-acetyltransferase
MIGGVRITNPPAEIIGARVVLRRCRYPDDSLPLREAINASLEHLRGWMAWAQSPATGESVRLFLETAARDFGGDSAAHYAITLRGSGEYVGVCGLEARIGEGALEIGYWADVRHTKRGLVTEAAHLLTTTALALAGVTRVEIHCDEANVRSAAVPRRLGYHLDRIEADEIEAPKEVGRSMIWVADAVIWSAVKAAPDPQWASGPSEPA